MEVLHEAWPVLAGMFLPPLVYFATRSRMTLLAFVLPAVALGLCASFLAGEISGSVGSTLAHVGIDAALTILGSYLSYRLFWRQIFTTKLRQERGAATRRPRR